MREYERFRAYMKSEYGPGPWPPSKKRPGDGWLAWCETYQLDPLTGKTRPTPVREDQDDAVRKVAS